MQIIKFNMRTQHQAKLLIREESIVFEKNVKY